jgi:peptide/nickel transport system ATP-binding protein
LTYIFISHDLNVVQYIADRVLVMYLGEIVEIGPSEAIYRQAKHPYTCALLDSRLALDPRERVEAAPLSGDPPNPINPPSGCRFRTRCPFAEPVCTELAPRLGDWSDRVSHLAACHMADPTSSHSRAGKIPASHGRNPFGETVPARRNAEAKP